MRRRGVKNLDTRIVAHPEILCAKPCQNIGKWHQVFQNDHPIHLEIGMGKGDFIIELATKNPQINYIGLEKFASVIVVALDKIVKSGLKNIILICDDASNLLETFAPNEIDKIYLNFSDPWPKNRHEKRRLTYNTFLEKYQKILKKDASLEFKTDNQGLFSFSLKSFNNHGWYFERLSLDLHHEYDTTEIAKTEYEKRFIGLGQPIYFLEVKKDK